VPKIARFFIFGHCGEEILAVAKKCKHCGAWLDDQNETAANVGPRHGGKPKSSKNKWKIAVPVLILAIVIGGYLVASNQQDQSEKDVVAKKADPVINFDICAQEPVSPVRNFFRLDEKLGG